MALARMAHSVDPADELRDKIGDLSEVEIFHNMVLVATYIRPDKTAGGIILTQTTREEDRYQGKVGLVLKKGPVAFQDDAVNQFHDVDVKVGEWIFYSMTDGWQVTINGVHCRMLQDVHIKGRVARPDAIY